MITEAQKRIEVMRDKFGNQLSVERNIVTGGANRIIGLNLNVEHYGLKQNELDPKAISALITKIASDYSEITGIVAASITVKRALPREGKWFIDCYQTFDNIPVFGSKFDFAIGKKGNIYMLRGNTFPLIDVASTTSKISPTAASGIATADFLSKHDSTAKVEGVPTLFVYPSVDNSTVKFNLTWVLSVSSAKPTNKWQYIVDAQSGEIISSVDMMCHGGKLTTYVNRYYWPLHHDDTPAYESPFSGVHAGVMNYGGSEVDPGTTDNNGYRESSYLATGWYYFKYVKNFNDLSGSYVAIANGETKTEYSSWLWPPASYTKNWATDETNVYHHVNVIHDYFVAAPYNYTAMNYQMYTWVHDGPNSNGWSDGIDIGFGSQNDLQWARAADVIYHEYTHSTIFHIYGYSWIYTSPDMDQAKAMNEGFADYFACAKTEDEIMGESVNINRDLGNTWTMDDYLYEKYHDGQIIAGACWDLRQVLSSTDALVFSALTYNPTDFSDFADVLVLVDDDDDNLSNGTPNLETIRSKFYAKKIYFSEGPPGAPQNVAISGSTGQHPTISWSANHEPDLGGYKIYRKITPDEQSFSLVATVGTSQTSYTDPYVTVRTGTAGQYANYYVKAYDNSSYLSIASNTVNKPVNYNPPKLIGDDQNGTVRLTPEEFALTQNYPNPFNPSTQITVAIPEASTVSLVVYDMLGREIKSLLSSTLAEGYHSVTFDGAGLPSGVYVYKLLATPLTGDRAKYVQVRKMLLNK
jgi:hypothetical protein